MAKKIRHYISRIKDGKLSEMRTESIWVFSYGKKHLLAIVLYTIVGLSSIILGLLSSLNSKDLVDIITGHDTGAVLKSFLILILLQLLSVLVGQLSGFISTVIATKVTNDIKSDIYAKILSSEWESLSSFHSGDISARWSGDSSVVAYGILTLVPSIVQIIFRFGSALFLVVRYDPSFAVFALIGAPITLLTTKKNLARMKKTGMSAITVNTHLSSFTSEAFSNFQYIKAFNLSSMYSRKVKEIQSQQLSSVIMQQKAAITNSLLMTIISSIVSYATYGWGIYKVWNGSITYGTMTMFLTMSAQLSSSLQSLINIFPTTLNLSNSVKRLIAISELPKEDLSQEDEVCDFVRTHCKEGVGLNVKAATYSYKNGTEVFNGVCFEASPNEVVALVGPSGQGKTTMLRLLLALINAQEGKCLITSYNGGETMPLTASCRQLFSYVPQGNTMFSGTIAENMRFIKEDATDEEIIDALKLACAWEFVEKLPDGINTVIRERGLGFSEGQAQRLSIARALIRKSPILLLDEATSALDVYTEKELLNNILNDDYPRTTIVTAHRLTVLRACNRVYKIHDKTCTLMSDEEVQELMNM